MARESLREKVNSSKVNSPKVNYEACQMLPISRFIFGLTGLSTRWSMTLSSEVNLPHVINARAMCGAHLVTLPFKFGKNGPPQLHRVDDERSRRKARSV